MTLSNDSNAKAVVVRNTLITVVLMMIGCSVGAGDGEETVESASEIGISVGKAAGNKQYPATLFGVNANWVSSGFGVIQNGEILRDRSFRNQSNPANVAWFGAPEKSVKGKVTFKEKGGAPDGYPGYVEVSQKGEGYSCVSQGLGQALTGGTRYALRVLAKGESAQPALSVFFAGADFLPVEQLDNLSFIELDAWKPYDFVLEPSKDVAGGMLRVCLVNAGEVAIDELRLSVADQEPVVHPTAQKRIKDLGIRSLRWPAGTDADFFLWRESVGPLASRGEVPTAFGKYQTPSFGLHEFLDYCESAGLEPLITVNIRQKPHESADLVDYILGPSSSSMGKLRAKNGRAKPWAVRYFELGNEPSENYAGKHNNEDTVRGYIEMSRNSAAAMRARAADIGAEIQLLGVLEAGFTVADWIAGVPMLEKWNREVLDAKRGLRGHADLYKGNFYSFFQHRKSEQALTENVLGGGATIVRSVDKYAELFPGARPFWLTEYGIMIRKNRPAEIVVDRLKDYLAGISAADILLSGVEAGFGGAYLFNLSEIATWGILRSDMDFRVRPAGVAFSVLSALAGADIAPVTVKGSGSVTLKSGDGNNPSGLKYPLVSAVAGVKGGKAACGRDQPGYLGE